MRRILLIVILVGAAVGCAHHASSPVAPGLPDAESAMTSEVAADDWGDPHRLWGEFIFYFNAAHDKVEAVPRRHGRFHLNALKFLEDYCSDCLRVVDIHNNGDDTVNLTVRIRHPFKGFPQYTAFDVKGIIMFNGSCGFSQKQPKIPLPDPFYVSWREMGDPEVLNADGYTPRWSPTWDSGSQLPIFNYWEGKFATGIPGAHLNAFINFYSHEERHVFLTDCQVDRTYHIWLPPGEPVVAGYAVEACWEPPTVTPVTNPIEDFPITANQPEAYCFKYVVNNGQEITDCDEWTGGWADCDVQYIDLIQWGGLTSDRFTRFLHDIGGLDGFALLDCDPPMESRFGTSQMAVCEFGNGTHRGVCLNYRFDMGYYHDIAYTVFDWAVNDPNLDD